MKARVAPVIELLPYHARFRPVRRLGAGGFGVVELVEIRESKNPMLPAGQFFACKHLGKQWAKDPYALVRFEREIEQMRTMKHPRIVPLVGLSVPGDTRAYLMPAYARSLRAALRRKRKAQPPAIVLAFVADIADALHHAHTLGFIHRDIKPENILLNKAGHGHVADWGLGAFVHQHSRVLLNGVRKLGTSYYASAEQWTTGAGTAQSDIYSLGMVLAEMLMARHVRMKIPGLGVQVRVLKSKKAPAQAVTDFVHQMTALVPSGRPQSMAIVRDRLRELAVMVKR